MHNVLKVEVFEDILVSDIETNNTTKLNKTLNVDRTKLFSDAFNYTKSTMLSSYVLPSMLNWSLRHIQSDDKSRYVRLFELSTKVATVDVDDKKIQLDLTFEIYIQKETDTEDCELLSLYSAEHKPEVNEN